MYWPRKFLGQGVRSQPTIAWKDGFKGLAGGGRVISIWKKAAWPHARQRPLLPTRSPKITSTLDTVVVMSLPLAEVLRDHWPDFVRRHRPRLAAAHHRAARAVLACRTPVLGGHVWKCTCKNHPVHYAHHSCNHRSCPRCGALDQRKWAAVQEARLLPDIPYFLVTLTVPDALRGICKLQPAILYDLLLREAAGALKDICLWKIGGLSGSTAVLHTWDRQHQHHPHVHLVIPAVTLDPAGRSLRRPADPAFLIHGTPLAARFRNRLERALKDDPP